MKKSQRSIIILMVFLLAFCFSFAGCNSDKDKKIQTEKTEPGKGTESAETGKEGFLYVSTDGDDNNDGTLKKPFKTIQKGASEARAGDTVYIRGGTYFEVVTVLNSGTEDAPIIISGYPGEQAVLDGENILPEGEIKTAKYIPIFNVQGSYVLVKDMTVRNSRGRGVQAAATGEYVTFRNLSIYHIYMYGVGLRGRYGVLEDSEISDCSFSVLVEPPGPYATAIIDTSDCIMRRNFVHDVHNEGMGILRSSNSVIEDNLISSTRSCSIYLDNAINPLVQRNILYQKEGSQLYTTTGIVVADEHYASLSSGAMGKGAVIINNIVSNTTTGFTFWKGQRADSALIDMKVSNNTFINIAGVGIRISEPLEKQDSNTVFENNIIHVKLGAKLIETSSTPIPGITFRNNCWSGAPGGWWGQSGDVYGNPGLLLEGSIDQPEYYKLLADSICIDKALTVPEVAEDFFKHARGSSPDIGAVEYQGKIQSSPDLSPASELKDVKAEDRSFEYINLLLAKNIISASSDNTFRPEDTVTVDEFIKMAVASMGVLEDIKGEYSGTADHIAKAKELKIIIGTEFTDYTLPIKRGEIAPILAKSCVIRGEANPSNMTECRLNIKDYSSIKPMWATFALQIYSKGIIALNTAGEYNAESNITRAEAAEIIAKFLEPGLRERPEG